ncbi:unnamed protein product (macronuclear) [Paramecium tetraurelia]|uniref:Calmodulin n=1 Tax=Paramecium tetraurelia TaxID=5888 RepID=Q3SDA6_PARTE|nr:uncharacterized protein GSPATT00009965001 [Paramecium tetraurelia]CAI44457.1 centrin3c-from-infraciliary-lattice [Paramecium tetraurelia]CAK73693.1 unnamed protein product [Paramecium tetraurelia]|eukprot:XP_001441090.1 hypothetical protein (macronuclear) [Paramecium tetraurelia strain d4-2]
MSRQNDKQPQTVRQPNKGIFKKSKLLNKRDSMLKIMPNLLIQQKRKSQKSKYDKIIIVIKLLIFSIMMELREAFEASGIKTYHNKFIYQVLGELDTDNSGGIDFEEFLHLATAKISDKDTREQIQKVFNLYDWNKEGRITWDELKRVAQDLGEEMTDEEIQHMFKKADLDDDGFVTFDDFYNLMTQKEYGKQ